MIIYENKGFETNSNFPNTDWTGEALYVVEDGSNIANKIKVLYPYYDFVTDENGRLIDVVEVEHEEPTQTPSEVEQLRADIDYIAIMTGVTL